MLLLTLTLSISAITFFVIYDYIKHKNIDTMRQEFLNPTYWRNATLPSVKHRIKFLKILNFTDAKQYTPLMHAVQNNQNPYIIKELILMGDNVNHSLDNGTTVLMLASSANKNAYVIKTLVEMGADINAQNSLGFTALMHASFSNDNEKIIALLIDNGANINKVCSQGLTPLLLSASHNKNPKITKTLISAGANPYATDIKGNTVKTYIKTNPAYN